MPETKPPPRQVVIIAALGVIVIGGAAVAALAYNAIVHGGGTDGLTTIAAVCAGGLVSTIGGTAVAATRPHTTAQDEPSVASGAPDSPVVAPEATQAPADGPDGYEDMPALSDPSHGLPGPAEALPAGDAYNDEDETGGKHL